MPVAQGQSAASGPVQPGGSNLVADFGADCPIGITRHLTLTLSNHTALQAPVQLWVDRFRASNNGEHHQYSTAARLCTTRTVQAGSILAAADRHCSVVRCPQQPATDKLDAGCGDLTANGHR